jgi:hypothetical protein
MGRPIVPYFGAVGHLLCSRRFTAANSRVGAFLNSESEGLGLWYAVCWLKKRRSSEYNRELSTNVLSNRQGRPCFRGEVHCILRIIPLELPVQMKLKLSLFGLMAGVALLVSGCAGLSGPNALGQHVLVVCKTTPDQQAAAKKLSNQYFSEVASGKKARPVRRYVAVQTLDPNEKQRGKYVKTRDAAQQKATSKGETLGADWVEPASLHCIMVFDVVTHESVGTNCYVVGSLPKVDDVFTYDTFPAEFVASSAEFVSP